MASYGLNFIAGTAAQASDNKLNNWLQYNYLDYVTQRLSSFDQLDIDQVLQLYNITTEMTDVELCDSTLVSDIRATCPVDEMSRVAANVSKSPVYRYRVR